MEKSYGKNMDWAAEIKGEVAVEMEKTAEFVAEDGRWKGEDMRKRNPGFREEGRRELGERENLKTQRIIGSLTKWKSDNISNGF